MRLITPARRRAMFATLCALAFAACTVPEKQKPDTDGGTPDAGADAGPQPPVDSEAPDTKIDQGPDMFSRTAQAVFRFSSDDPSASFMCRVDTDAPAPCTSPLVRNLGDGPHNFAVRAVDSAGNSDDTPAEAVWTIDTMPPDTMLLTAPPPADNSVQVVFTFRSPEENVTFECSLDGSAFLSCTSGLSFGPVGDGAHAFAVRARDRAGNIDATPAIYAWSVDTSTPDTQILSSPPDASRTTAATFTFISPDAGGGATFQCALDGAAFAACTSPRAFSALTEGAHTFSVRVRDAVGNFNPTPATRAWTVNLTPPETTITAGPTSTVPMASANFTFTANEPGVTFECNVDNAGFAACMSPLALTAMAQGGHSFAVRATDAAGNTDASPAMRSWMVDTIAPDVAITAGPAAASTSGPRVTFAFTVSDGTFTCSFDAGPFAACATPVAVNLPAGMHQFAVRAIDGVGNVTTVTRAWTIACSAPDPGGAAGVLHLDDTGQTLANAVTGGAPAILGDTTAVEVFDPAPLAGGRFGGELAFTAAEGDHVTWPLAVPAMSDLTIELWARPNTGPGAHDIAISGDGRIALRVAAAGPMAVQFSIAITEGAMAGMTRVATSAAVAAGAWHHVLVSLQQPALRMWVDGARTDGAAVALGAPLALDALRLGGSGAAAYDGALDEVWIAPTAITTDEAARGRYCPL